MMRIAACALLVMASMFGCGIASAAEQEQPSAAQMMDDLMYGHGPIGGPFTLTDQNGKPRRDIDFRGKLNPDVLIPMHCSGLNFTQEAQRQMPGKVLTTTTGTRISFGI